MEDIQSQHKFAAYVAIVVAALGVIDLILVCYTIGFVDGLSSAFNDPGKSFFHICLLPLACLIFFRNFSLREIFSVASRSQRKLMICLAILAFLCTLAATIKDHVDGICSRISPPDAYADLQLREKLFNIQRDNHNKLRSLISEKSFQNESKIAYEEYKSHLIKIQGNDCSRSYISLTSYREKWALFISVVAGMFVISVFWSLLAHMIIRQRPSQRLLEAYMVTIALIIPWLFLRAYSEWYLHFGNLTFESYTSYYIGIVLAVAAAIILFILNLKRRVKLVAVSLLTGIPAVLSLIGALKPEWFGVVARVWYVLDVVEIAIIYSIIGGAIISVIWFLLSPMAEHER